MVKFVVSRQLSTDVILGCDFLDQHTNWIGTHSKTLILKDDSEVLIFRRPVSKMPIEQPEKENTNSKRERKLFSNIRVAKRIKLAPRVETIILARCEDAGSCFLQSEQSLYERKRSLLANGYVESRNNVPLKVVVANFSDKLYYTRTK